jgi:putative two-component system response regulator
LENRILIVDDEMTIYSIVARRLGQEGYSCVMANDGKEALGYFYNDHFSLIISDIRMPEMNGLELLKNVKTVQPKMMFIIMTAYPEIEMATEAIRLGATDFILKPVDLELLVFSVKKAFEQKRIEDEIESYHKNLEKLVEERTAKLQRTLLVLKSSHLDSVKVLAGAIDAKDPYARGHSDRVREMSMGIGVKMGFSEDRLENLLFGALLHDIGKIGIRDEILQKKELLTPEEYQHIQQHPLIGVKIVEGVDFFKDKIPMIRNHHEQYDGSGYPDGLIGEVVPLEARIIAVADAFDAMTSLRPHRRAIPLCEVIIEMEKGKGKQFDPRIVEIFLRDRIYDSSITA